MEEIWKPCYGFENIYIVSNNGGVKGVDRIIEYKNGNKHKWKAKEISISFTHNGYLHFQASNCNIKKDYKVHTAVWEAFNGPIPEGYEIHHKNFIKTDNRLDNLECLTKEEHRKLHMKKNNIELKSKPVLQYTLDGIFVAEYPSAREADRVTGINQSRISHCCKGDYGAKTAGGFIWKYKEVA